MTVKMNKILFSILFLHSFLQSSDIPIASIYDLMQQDAGIEYFKCHDAMPFDYKPFPLSVYPQFQPWKGMFAETFVAKIPNGTVCSAFGFVAVENNIIKELLSQNFPLDRYKTLLKKMNMNGREPKRIHGKVAVLTRIGTDIYGHWLADVLARLEMMRMHNIEYDWLYVPHDRLYIRETLALLGVDPAKIIEPFGDNYYIQADELIVPSLTIRRVPAPGETNFSDYHPCTFYCADWNIDFLRNSFLPYAQAVLLQYKFPEKVFITRKDATSRRIVNEDEIFALFEPYGFRKISMTGLTFVQQVALFHQAKVIVAGHGSALTNLIFCEPGIKVVEIFQNQFDSGFWQLSDQRGLEHYCVKTQEDIVEDSFKVDTFVPIEIIQSFIDACDWLN